MSTITAVPLQPTKRGVLVLLWIGVIIAALAAAGLAAMAPGDPVVGLLAANKRQKGVIETPSGLQYLVIAPGAGGAHPTDADIALVNYEGKLPDGSTFDKSSQPQPMPVTGVVPGFSEALKLMSKGAKYRFWIKPTLGYGAPRPAGAPPLDPAADKLAKNVLIFDVELIDFLPEATVRQMQMQQQMMQQGGAPGAPGAPGVQGPPPGAAPGR
ncbi:FKBP-type peptidyl-prolyl cis-trans isomerase [Sphingomonas endolithica]|uniref:FKBP-type peptidyl-prolyl cis-trans isomerase n=1 Tax=Sphingomonas endolithica TaxID=2972485 RepID=UPI0021AEA472|nr:FKBP-type peptidyl-prolyl cis-trans isomerase [Sphingomonas sp. ZFBP2030]